MAGGAVRRGLLAHLPRLNRNEYRSDIKGLHPLWGPDFHMSSPEDAVNLLDPRVRQDLKVVPLRRGPGNRSCLLHQIDHESGSGNVTACLRAGLAAADDESSR